MQKQKQDLSPSSRRRLAKFNYKNQLPIIYKLISLPFRNISLRMNINNFHRPYYGIIDCADSIIMNEGLSSFWRGYFLDIAYIYGYAYVFGPSKEPLSFQLNFKSIIRLLGKFLKTFICICFTYCDLVYKIDPGMKIQNLWNSLVDAFVNKDRHYALLGASIIYFTNLAHQNMYRYLSIYRPFNSSFNLLKRIFCALITFPFACLGLKMLQKSLLISESVKQMSLKGLAPYILSVICEGVLTYLIFR